MCNLGRTRYYSDGRATIRLGSAGLDNFFGFLLVVTQVSNVALVVKKKRLDTTSLNQSK